MVSVKRRTPYIKIWQDLAIDKSMIFLVGQRQEVDFVIANEGEPLFLVEAKLSDTGPSPALKKFQGVLKKPAIQLVEDSKGHYVIPNGDQYILVAPAYQWLSSLP